MRVEQALHSGPSFKAFRERGSSTGRFIKNPLTHVIAGFTVALVSVGYLHFLDEQFKAEAQAKFPPVDQEDIHSAMAEINWLLSSDTDEVFFSIIFQHMQIIVNYD